MEVKRQHPDLLDALTKRELEILSLMKDGLSNAQIAIRLVLSAETVKWYIKEIYSKLGVSSRTQALKWADEFGLLATTDETVVSKSGPPRHNLPAALTPFVGRVRELETLNGLLRQRTNRLVTILGLGGMGKTRLALAVAAAVLREYVDGVFFVPLAPLTSPDELIPTVADAIHFTFSPDSRTPRQQLLDYLRSKHLLLVLDNFEHLLDDTSLVTDILRSAPQISILVTSRERLDIQGEQVSHLEGLDVPQEADEERVYEFSAVQLFMQLALHAQSDFVADAADVVGICRLVQGMPLAIELAAAWVGVLSLSEIIDEIRQSADFLRTTMRNVPERLRSVRTVFEMSWAQLSVEEQTVFRRFSVFRGGCSRAAAAAITGATPGLLAALVNRALVWLHPQSERYEIHELLRQYSNERLEAAGEAEQVRDAHLTYFAAYAHEWSRALKAAKHLEALDRLDAEVDNIRLALRRAIDKTNPEALDPFTDYWYYCDIRGLWDEGQKLFGEAIASLQPYENATLGKLMIGRVIFLERLDNDDEWMQLARTSLDVLRHFDVVEEVPLAINYVASALVRLHAYEEAKVIYREGAEIAQTHDNQWIEAIIYYGLGGIAMRTGHFDTSRDFFHQAYVLMRSLNNIWGLSWIVASQAELAFRRVEHAEAQRLYEESLTQARRIGNPRIIEDSLTGLSQLAYQRGDYATATDLAEAMVKMQRNTGRYSAVISGLIWLAEIALRVDDQSKAKQRLVEARTTGDPDRLSALFFLLIVVDLWMQTGKQEQAVELLSLIDNHPLLVNQYRGNWDTVIDQKLLNLRGKARSELPPQVFNAAYERGKKLDLEVAVTELISSSEFG